MPSRESGTLIPREEDTEQVSFRCPRELYEALVHHANVNDRTVSGELRRAIRLHLLHVGAIR